MLSAGDYHTLKVGRIAEPGIYLEDEEGNEVLLPNRYVSLEDKVGDMAEVFVYHDSENRLIATRERPLAKVGEAAVLKVVDRNVHGVFMDWGITAKDLFMPNHNFSFDVEIGKRYPVYLYRDNVSGRVVATTRLNPFVNNAELTVRPKEQVDILVARRADIGYRVIINNRHWGMIYNDQIFRPVAVGDKLTGYIRHISEDARIDVMLQQEGADQMKAATGDLLSLLKKNNGRIEAGDRSSPEEIARLTGMSKKNFKRAAGALYKQRLVTIDDRSITLNE